MQQCLRKQDQQPTDSPVHIATVNEKMFSSEITLTFKLVKFPNFLSRLGLMCFMRSPSNIFKIVYIIEMLFGWECNILDVQSCIFSFRYKVKISVYI